MPDTFTRTVEALVETLVDEMYAGAGPVHRERVCAYVTATVAAMPDHFHFAFRLLGLAFEVAPMVRGGRRFTQLSPAARLAHVQRWRNSALGVPRAMIAFYEAFAAHGLYCAVYAAETFQSTRIAA